MVEGRQRWTVLAFIMSDEYGHLIFTIAQHGWMVFK